MTLIKKTNKWHDTRFVPRPAANSDKEPEPEPGPYSDPVTISKQRRCGTQPKKEKNCYLEQFISILWRRPCTPRPRHLTFTSTPQCRDSARGKRGKKGRGNFRVEIPPFDHINFWCASKRFCCSYLLHFYVKCAVRYAILFFSSPYLLALPRPYSPLTYLPRATFLQSCLRAKERNT